MLPGCDVFHLAVGGAGLPSSGTVGLMHPHNLTLYCRDKVRQEFYEKELPFFPLLFFLHYLKKTNSKAYINYSQKRETLSS